MNMFKKLFKSSDKRRKNVVLLIKIRHEDDTITEKRQVVERHEIQHVCDMACANENVKEVWVYQKIFHHIQEDKSQGNNSVDVDLLYAAMGVAVGNGFKN